MRTQKIHPKSWTYLDRTVVGRSSKEFADRVPANTFDETVVS
jgi:hypothetical protein